MSAGRRSFWPLEPVILYDHVLALNVAGFAEAFA